MKSVAILESLTALNAVDVTAKSQSMGHFAPILPSH